MADPGPLAALERHQSVSGHGEAPPEIRAHLPAATGIVDDGGADWLPANQAVPQPTGILLPSLHVPIQRLQLQRPR